MLRWGTSRAVVILGTTLGVAAVASAEESPAPITLTLPPLAVPAPPRDVDPAPAPTTVPPALESLPPLGAPVSSPVAPAPVAAVPLADIPPDRRPVLVVPGLPVPRSAPANVSARPADSGILRLPTGRQDGVDRPSGMRSEMRPESYPAQAARLAAPGPDPGTTTEPIPDGPPPLVTSESSSDPLSADGPPPLLPPSGGEGVALPTGRPRLESPVPRYSAEPPPGTLTLEPSREGSPGALSPSRGQNATNTVDAGVVNATPPGQRAPSRRRLFDLFRPPTPAPPADPPPAPVAAGEPSRIEPQDAETIRVQPRSDPVADAALKRRLETQIQSAMGNQLRALDVRVVDRTVHVRAAVTRFWQKRSARRTLETLPALAGYRTRIEVID